MIVTRLLLEDQLDPFRVASLFDFQKLTFVGETDFRVIFWYSVEAERTENFRVEGRFEDRSDEGHEDLEGVFAKLVQVTKMLYVLEHVRRVQLKVLTVEGLVDKGAREERTQDGVSPRGIGVFQAVEFDGPCFELRQESSKNRRLRDRVIVEHVLDIGQGEVAQ